MINLSLRSLAYIHSNGICHRDIKPQVIELMRFYILNTINWTSPHQNLLLDPESGILKLCDFGSAKHLVRGEPNVSYICSRYYRSLVNWSCPQSPKSRNWPNFFRAPELIFGATDYTTNIDVWSAGCVFAELMLGQVKARANQPQEKIIATYPPHLLFP